MTVREPRYTREEHACGTTIYEHVRPWSKWAIMGRSWRLT
jgi:hypothetical protein